MAHLNGTSSLTRARSLRAPPNASKLAPPSSRVNTSGAGAPSTTTFSTSHPTTTAPTGPSNVSLFLTNLRLLDLDLHPDWPDINTLTFSTKDAAQQGGQKKRIQAVEWALYHLFRLWDPDETRNKLQPFFPPLDQVQSLNLRAALLRGLEQAKKNGVLGRDAVVRRTMLDECKGERLEEVLAVFSSAVLKKVVGELQQQQHRRPRRQLDLRNGAGHAVLAQTLALENRGYSGERAELAALVLVHKVSLSRMLREKSAARARFKEFADLLALKEKTVAKRRAEAEAARRSGQAQAISEDQKREVCRAVRNNWTGSETWMETLLYGDSKSQKDGVLTAPFDRVWRRVQSGRLAELEDASSGLLGQLDDRVQGQRERLERWQGFRQRMFGKSGSEPTIKQPEPQSQRKGIDLGFGAHRNMHLGRMSPRKLPHAKSGQLDSHYEALVNGLKADLARISPATQSIPSFFQRPQQPERPWRMTEEAETHPESISEISDIEDSPPPIRLSPSRRETIRVEEEPAFEPVLRKAKTFDDEIYEHAYANTEAFTPSRLRRSATFQSRAQRRPVPDSPTKRHERRPSSGANPILRTSTPPPVARSPSPARTATPSPSPPPSPERPVSPTQQLADQILASVSAASPSPVKRPRHRLSLAERTRLSMARRTSHANLRVPTEDEVGFYDQDQDEALAKRERAPIPAIPIVAEPSSFEEEDEQDGSIDMGHEDLVARTRRSMAGSEAARQKAQLERRRSLRKGGRVASGGGLDPSTPVAAGSKSGGGYYFPAVDEEEGEGNTTLLLAEELINGQHGDDYAAVFMSRPKLKTSPVGTPVRGFWGE